MYLWLWFKCVILKRNSTHHILSSPARRPRRRRSPRNFSWCTSRIATRVICRILLCDDDYAFLALPHLAGFASGCTIREFIVRGEYGLEDSSRKWVVAGVIIFNLRGSVAPSNSRNQFIFQLGVQIVLTLINLSRPVVNLCSFSSDPLNAPNLNQLFTCEFIHWLRQIDCMSSALHLSDGRSLGNSSVGSFRRGEAFDRSFWIVVNPSIREPWYSMLL